MTSNNLTCQQYNLDISSAHAVFSAAAIKVITMIVIKENYCLCNCLIKCVILFY